MKTEVFYSYSPKGKEMYEKLARPGYLGCLNRRDILIVFSFPVFRVVRHFRLSHLIYIIINIVIPIISSVTSVNLKKACMASRNIVSTKQYTLFLISFAVVFGLLVFGP